MSVEVNHLIEPLELGSWFDALQVLQKRQSHVDGSGQESVLRHAYHLMQLAPAPLVEIIRSDIDEACFEQLLAAGAYDAAAVALVGSPMGFTISRAVADKPASAEVYLSVSVSSGSVEAESMSGALVGAWCQAITSIRSKVGIKDDRQDRRKGRSGRGQQLTEH